MAARYAYECPQCHSTIELSTTQAGQNLKCHKCSAEITAPKLGVIKSLPPVGGVATKSASKAGSLPKSDSGSPLRSWLFAGGLLLAVIAGIGGAAAQYRANQFYVEEVNIDEVIKREHEKIDKAPASEIYALVASSTDESFRLEYSEAGYRTANIKRGIMQWVAGAAFGVAGIGCLMLLFSFFLKR